MTEELREQLQIIDNTEMEGSSLEKHTLFQTLNWEIGMSIGSSSGEQNPEGFITIVFKGVDQDGKSVEHPVSFSPQQFVDFTQNVARMQKAVSSFN